ncbi:MAG TPA: ATP-binding protein [Planktothrix sp.]
MKLRLIHKGILLVSIPLCFEIVLFSILISMQNQMDIEARRVDRARRINDEINHVIRNLVGFTSLSQTLRDANTTGKLHTRVREVEISITELMHLTKDDPQLYQVVLTTKNAFLRAEKELRTAPAILRATPPEQLRDTIHIIKARIDADLQDVVTSGMLEMASRSMAGQDEIASAKMREQFLLYLRAALVLSIVVALAAAALYTYHLSTRLARVKENAARLGSDKQLLPRVPGDDEIAELDGALHFAKRWMDASEKKERAILAYASDIICALDKKLHLTSLNPLGETVLAGTDNNILQESLLKFVVDEDKERVQHSFAAVLESGTPAQIDATLKCADGSTKETTISTSFASSEQALYCVIHDVTAQKQLERMRQEVTAMITHDLRTPLQSVKSFMEMLEFGRLGEISEQGVRLLGLAQRESGRMAKLIDSVLQLEKLRSHTVELQKSKIALDELIKNSCNAVTILAGDSEIEVVAPAVPDHIVINGDPAWLEQVVVNLLGNAIKFSPKKSEIEVRGKTDESNHFGEISIKDQGPGISDTEKALIFERFHRMESTKQVEGTGLGLSICKELVELHGGYIRIDSRPGEGSTFIIGIPLAV